MKNFKIGVAQLLSDNGNLEENTNKALFYMKQASKEKVDLLLFPECFLTGYHFPISTREILDENSYYIQRIRTKAKELSISVVITTFTKGVKKPRNTAFIIDSKGDILLRYDKVHTCDFADEKMIENGTSFPVCTLNNIQLGVMICYDREYPESARELMLNGAEIILVPNNCGSMKPRLCALQTRAYENMTGVVMANAPGNNAGNSCAYSPIAWDRDGNCLDMEMMMADDTSEDLYYVTYDMEQIRFYREHEMMGNTFRKCIAYKNLQNEEIKDPFLR